MPVMNKDTTKLPYRTALLVLLALASRVSALGLAAESTRPDAAADLRAFAQSITRGATGNYEKAQVLLHWQSPYFAWSATDYQERTPAEIIAHKERGV